MALGPYDVGCTAVYALAADPRFSYCLYVPAKPSVLTVVVHGSPRTFMAFRDRFADFAEANDAAVLCPLFPVGVSGDGNADGYKYLTEPGIRYDRVLIDMVEEVARRWEVPKRFGLFGFSGGAQFVNRFLLLHPARLWAASIAAPGSVTLVDDRVDWWVGVRDLEAHFGMPLDREALQRVPVQTLVGGADTDTDEITHRPSRRYWMEGANDAGATRPQRAEALRQSLVEAGVSVTHEVLAGVGHDPWPAIECAKPFLADMLRKERAAHA
jgi:poly(3-hydroxybutyrate) depolymerase